MHLSRAFWASRDFPLFESEGEKGGGGAGESDSKAGTESNDKGSEGDKTGNGEKGDDKEALRRLGEQRDAARAEAKKVQEERDALLKEKQDREAAETKRKEKEAAEAGKFEELAATREQERDEAKTEATSLKAENDQLKAAMAEGITSGWKDLPEEVRKIGEKQHAEEDVLGRFQFLNDPDTKALVKKLAEKADPKRGNGIDPKPNGSGKVADDVKQKAQASLYRNF